MPGFGTTLSSAIIGGVAAAVGVPAVFALLRKTQSYRYVDRVPGADNELTVHNGRWDLLARFLLIPSAGIPAYILWLLFCTAENKRAALLGAADFVLTPRPVVFALPALFAGILFAAVLLRILLTGILGREGYDQLLDYSDRRSGINSQLIMRHMTYVGVPLIVASVMLAFHTYATADAQGFTIHPCFAIHERHYSWADVNKIVLVRSFRASNGVIQRGRPYYIVEMGDGFQLNFHRTVLEIPIADQRRFASFVAANSHRNVDVEDR